MSTNSPEPTVTRGDFRCPWCNVDNDAAMAVEELEARPTPGSITVCWNCGSVSIVTESLHLRRPRPDENAEILDNSIATRLRAEILLRNRNAYTRGNDD